MRRQRRFWRGSLGPTRSAPTYELSPFQPGEGAQAGAFLDATQGVTLGQYFQALAETIGEPVRKPSSLVNLTTDLLSLGECY